MSCDSQNPPAQPQDESDLQVVFDKAGQDDQAEATRQRQQRVWAFLAERWATPEEAEDLKRMKDRSSGLVVRGLILFQTFHGVEHGFSQFFSMHLHFGIHNGRIIPKLGFPSD